MLTLLQGMLSPLGRALGKAAQDYAALVLTDNPIAYWRLGESVGPTAVDAKGSHNGTYVGGTLGQTGLILDPDKCVLLDGVNDGITVPNSPAWDLSNLSIEFWVNVPNTTPRQMLFFLLGSTHYLFAFVLTGRIYVYDSLAVWSGVDTPIPAGVTTHFVLSRSPATNVSKMYMNGVLVRSEPCASGAFDFSFPFDLGYRSDTQVDYLAARLDEVAVYDYALSQAQVLAHYYKGLPTYRDVVLTDNPFAYWRLGESAGPTAVDEKGAHNGAYIGTTLGQPGLIAGPNTCPSFDGLDDNVTVPNSPAFDLSDLSIEFWVNLPGPASQEYIFWLKGPTDNLFMWIDGAVLYVYDSLAPAGGYDVLFSYGVTQHYVFSRSKTANRWDMFRNGVSVRNSTVAGGPFNFTSALDIGVRAEWGAYFGPGKLDEVAFYNYALTQAQAMAHYNKGIGA